ncbi:hypothetical protein RKD37_002529 [Streptomyces ambofaciens]
MERLLAPLGQQFVRLDRHHRVVVLHGDLEIVKVVLGEEFGFPHRRFDQCLRGRRAVACQDAGVERPGVDADAQRHAVVARGAGDVLDLVVEALDVARVDPHRRAARLDRREDVAGLEVDVGDDGERRLGGDRGQGLAVVARGDRDPDDVAARGRQFGDLLERLVHVRGHGRRHRLYGDGVVAADADGADHHLSCLAAPGRGPPERDARDGTHARPPIPARAGCRPINGSGWTGSW